MSMNTVLYFEIQAKDTEKASNFYATLFGWKFTKQEDMAIDYWHIETGGIQGGLLRRPAQAPAPEQGTNAFVCSIEVANFERTAKKIVEQGGLVALEKFAVPGKCWQGYFIDTDGNTFGIFEVDDQAA